MKMSKDGIELLIQFEALKTKAYRDSVGVWTIGVGHTAMAGPPVPKAGMVITVEEAKAILARDLGQYEAAVNAACGPALNQNQFDAMVSLCFNIGAGNFRKSSVVRKWNEGDVKGAADAFLAWNKAGGKVLKGLVNRRAQERAYFLMPVKAAGKPAEPVSEPEASQIPDKPTKPAGGAVAGAGGAVVAGGTAIKAAGFDWSIVLAGAAGIAIAAVVVFFIIQKRKSL